MSSVTLSRANKIIRVAFATAQEKGLKPLAICVYDAGGNLKAFQAQDGTSIGRFAIAGGKARGALAVGAGSRWLHKQAESRPHFVAGVSSVIEGGVIPGPGGVIARDKSGRIIAAVGVSGDTADNDEMVAVAGIESCGLAADIG